MKQWARQVNERDRQVNAFIQKLTSNPGGITNYLSPYSSIIQQIRYNYEFRTLLGEELAKQNLFPTLYKLINDYDDPSKQATLLRLLAVLAYNNPKIKDLIMEIEGIFDTLLRILKSDDSPSQTSALILIQNLIFDSEANQQIIAAEHRPVLNHLLRLFLDGGDEESERALRILHPFKGNVLNLVDDITNICKKLQSILENPKEDKTNKTAAIRLLRNLAAQKKDHNCKEKIASTPRILDTLLALIPISTSTRPDKQLKSCALSTFFYLTWDTKKLLSTPKKQNIFGRLVEITNDSLTSSYDKHNAVATLANLSWEDANLVNILKTRDLVTVLLKVNESAPDPGTKKKSFEALRNIALNLIKNKEKIKGGLMIIESICAASKNLAGNLVPAILKAIESGPGSGNLENTDRTQKKSLEALTNIALNLIKNKETMENGLIMIESICAAHEDPSNNDDRKIYNALANFVASGSGYPPPLPLKQKAQKVLKDYFDNMDSSNSLFSYGASSVCNIYSQQLRTETSGLVVAPVTSSSHSFSD